MGKSKIQWTDETWNITTGCTRVSAGCDNCYAVAMTKRLARIGHTEEKYGGLVNEGKDHFNGKVKTHPEVLEEPLHWQKPRRVFVNSMSDLFHPEVPFEFVAAVFGVMIYCKDHTFQVLTKRPDRMAEFFEWIRKGDMKKAGGESFNYDEAQKCIQFAISELDCKETLLMSMTNVNGREWPAPNLWLGTSVENQGAANERIPHLLKCPAAVRFLSCEPLLGTVSLRPNIPDIGRDELASWLRYGCTDSRIDWVIAGGESGPGARPMHPDWVRSLRDQCQEADVPFFFKQWGKYNVCGTNNTPNDDVVVVSKSGEFESHDEYFESAGAYNGEAAMAKVGKKRGGRQLDGQEWNQFPISEVE